MPDSKLDSILDPNLDTKHASDLDPDLTKNFRSLQILILFRKDRNTGHHSFRWRQSLISPLVPSYGNRQSWARWFQKLGNFRCSYPLIIPE